MKTGWINDQGRWYFLNSSGGMEAAWKTTDDVMSVEKTPDFWKHYFSNLSEVWVPGWLKYKNEWYYLNVNKDMAITAIKDEQLSS
nr:hypothetical protein [Neobacillus jeddahensis]